MAETVLYKFVFKKPASKQEWLNWCQQLMEREAEVLQTLEAEGVTYEACFISENCGYYLIEAESLDSAQAQADHSPFPIDAEHREIRDKNIKNVEAMKPVFIFKR